MRTARSNEDNAMGFLSRNEERVRFQARKKHALSVGHCENLAVDIMNKYASIWIPGMKLRPVGKSLDKRSSQSALDYVPPTDK